MISRLKRQTKKRHSAPLWILLLNLTAILPVLPVYARLLAADWRLKVAHVAIIVVLLGGVFIARRRDRRLSPDVWAP